MHMPPVQDQMAHLMRGIDTVLPAGELERLLAEDRPLRVKLGVDPTASDVTLGWAVVFRLLRRFQELGHTAVLIIGDFTAQVGDPSGKSKTRRRLASSEVDAYVSDVVDTIKELLLPGHLELRPNSEWLGSMSMHDVLALTGQLTVSRIMDRDDFTKRWDANEPISMIEFMYPLLQAYDSVAIEADIEIGGSDQLFNLLVGRDIQARYGQDPQVVMTVPLLVGTDGVHKMSQSLGNYISVKDEPSEMFGKTMSLPDHAMRDWFVLAADLAEADADTLIDSIERGEVHPGEAKRRLARGVVSLYWGRDAAAAAEQEFDLLFRQQQIPADVAEYAAPPDDPVWLPALLNSAELVSSNSEGRRMINQGAVKIDGRRVDAEEMSRDELVGKVLQVGKRRFVRVV